MGGSGAVPEPDAGGLRSLWLGVVSVCAQRHTQGEAAARSCTGQNQCTNTAIPTPPVVSDSLSLHLLCSFGTGVCFKEYYLLVNVYISALFSQVLLIVNTDVRPQESLSLSVYSVFIMSNPVFMSHPDFTSFLKPQTELFTLKYKTERLRILAQQRHGVWLPPPPQY